MVFFFRIHEELLAALRRCERTLDAAVYCFTDRRLFGTLQSLAQKGRRVRLLLGDSESNQGLDWNELRAKGAAVAQASAADPGAWLMHHKFCVVDGATVYTGSYNWTRRAATANFENLMLVDDPADVAGFAKEFEELWERFAPPESASVDSVPAGGGGARVLDLCALFRARVAALRTELALLESVCEDERCKALAYQSEYRRAVGDLPLECLKFETEIARRRQARTGREKERQEYQRAEEKWRGFQATLEAAEREDRENAFARLPSANQDELKRLYKEAMKLCHPDLHPDAAPDERERMKRAAQRLTAARKSGDLAAARQILEDLRSGVAGIALPTQATDSQTLQEMAAALEARREEWLARLRASRASKEYMEMSGIADRAAHFKAIRRDLELRRTALKKELTMLKKG